MIYTACLLPGESDLQEMPEVEESWIGRMQTAERVRCTPLLSLFCPGERRDGWLSHQKFGRQSCRTDRFKLAESRSVVASEVRSEQVFVQLHAAAHLALLCR